jgi:hypothetical protein
VIRYIGEGACYPRPSTASAILPGIKNASATPIRTGQPSSTSKYLRKSQSVAGQSESPENNANQPFVKGHGPRVIINRRPPTPAKSAQPHASADQSSGKNLAMSRIHQRRAACFESRTAAFFDLSRKLARNHEAARRKQRNNDVG